MKEQRIARSNAPAGPDGVLASTWRRHRVVRTTLVPDICPGFDRFNKLHSTNWVSQLMRSLWVLSWILLMAPRAGAVDVLARAVLPPSDQMYGVATIEIPLATPIPIINAPPKPISVSDEDGRVYYSVGDNVEVRIIPPSEQPVPQPGSGRLLSRLGSLIREITNSDAPKTQVVSRRASFLFVGDGPLRVRVRDENGEIGVYQLSPEVDDAAFNEQLDRWWQSYSSNAESKIEQGDYPPWVETYLVAMLSGRTRNGLPAWFLEPMEQQDPLLATLKYLGGAQETVEAIFRRTSAGLNDSNEPQGKPDRLAATEPLPEPPQWVKADLPAIDRDVATEPIASRVPPECFYLRFGSFANYLWFLDLTDEYGGDIGRMITLRGTKGGATEKFQNQIAVKLTELSRVLGPTVVEDQAVIGRDLFNEDGSSMGVIIKSTNAFLLRSSLTSDRSARANNDDSVSLRTVKVNGRDVSFLSSPDNSVRSYMVEDDGYFLITNSKTLVRRFLDVGRDGRSLAGTDSFRLSRVLVPIERNDTIFAYFSAEMMQGLLSPQYMIELRRRSQAKSDVSLVHLARLAAAAEGHSATSGTDLGVEDLIEQGFLPLSFGTRNDGSGVVALGDQVIDTMRGARGTFLPIADIEIDSVTPEESQWYSAIADEYTQRFPQIDPIMVALRRDDVAGNPGVEKLSIHAEIAPLIADKYGKWANQLGPPTEVAIRFAPDDLVAVQAHIVSEQLGPPTHLFAAIKDTFPPAPESFEGILSTYLALRQLPAYLGAWPQPGALDRLPLGLGRGRPVGPGMSKLIGGLYRYTGGGFSVLSFQPEVLNASLPHLQATDGDDPATVRGRVGSLLGSQLEGWVNNQLYQRAARSSRAGADLLDLFSQQLRVPPEDAMDQVTRVMGTTLQCSLGGEYSFDPNSGRWRSTAWPGSEPAQFPPPNYVAPILDWFRGSDFTATQYSDRLVADIEVTVARRNLSSEATETAEE